MRRRPVANETRGTPRNLASPPGLVPPSVPTTQGDVIEPFIQAGGYTFFPSGWDVEYLPPEPAGVQLLAAQYVPPGRTAFIKRIEVAPCAPPILVDPWRGWDAYFNTFTPSPDPYAATQRAPAQAGLWETPLAWQGYFAPVEGGYFVPEWHWAITIFPGDLAKYRADQAIPPFSPAVPASWFLALNVPVPWSAYGAVGGTLTPSLPGRMINGYVGPQAFPAAPSAPLPVHMLAPENSTILLWAFWRQIPLDPVLAFGPNGPSAPWAPELPPGLPPIWPLLPSVGRLVGYMQPATRDATAENAAHGWGA